MRTIAAVLLSLTLSSCIILPPWYGGGRGEGGYEHHDRGHFGERHWH